ncbi:hypothetical protein D3C85_1052730 [compost metagenome]
MKPGVERVCTGFLPQALAVSYRHSASVGSLARPETTSTSAMTGAGLKKCRPSRRCGCSSCAAMLVIDSDEVLLARMQCLPQMPSSWRNSARLTSRFSTMASMISSQSARASMASTACRRAMVALRDSADNLPLSTRLPSCRSMPSMAWTAAPGRLSSSSTGWPACAATWAMPAPMAPAPITAMRAEVFNAVMTQRPLKLGVRFSMKAPTPSR